MKLVGIGAVSISLTRFQFGSDVPNFVVSNSRTDTHCTRMMLSASTPSDTVARFSDGDPAVRTNFLVGLFATKISLLHAINSSMVVIALVPVGSWAAVKAVIGFSLRNMIFLIRELIESLCNFLVLYKSESL